MQKKFKINLCAKVISLIVVSCVLLVSFAGCTGLWSKKREPMTIEEIRQKTQEKFFDKDGNPIVWRWQNSYQEEYVINPINWDEFAITGFEVTIIKNLYGYENCYLVEFEPMGHFFGLLHMEFSYEHFRFFPSPFKLLNIDDGDRYIDFGPEPPRYAAMIDGEMVSILGIATQGSIFKLPYEGYKPDYVTYDFEAKKWINHTNYNY